MKQNPTNEDTNEALNLIQFLINFHDTADKAPNKTAAAPAAEEEAALNLIQFLINFHDIAETAPAPAAKAAEEEAAETETNNQSNVDSLLSIVERNLNDVFDTLNEKTHSSDVTQNSTNEETNEALNLIQFLIKFHDETNEPN